MGMQILMRETGSISPFREALLTLMKMPGETLILSSGYAEDSVLSYGSYFAEYIHEGFEAKQSKNTSVIVLGGKLRHKDPNHLKSRTKVVCNSITRTTSPGCKNCVLLAECWQVKFERFVNELRQKLLAQNKSHKVQFFRAKTDEYHGKIAIKLYKSKPIAAIVGSSNLTTPAFGVNINFFNNEADIFIWNGQVLKGTDLKGFKGVSIKDYDINDLKGTYTYKLKELIKTEIEYLSEYIPIHYKKNINGLDTLENLDIQQIGNYIQSLIPQLGIKDANEEVFQYLNNIIYYNNLINNINNNTNNLIEVLSPVILNVNPNKRTTNSILLDIHSKLLRIINDSSTEVLPQTNGNFYIC